MFTKSSPDKVSFTISTRFLKNKLLLIVLGAVIVLGGGFYWFMGTPQYSMWQLKTAIAKHDSELAMKYFNVDKMVDNVWPKMTSALMTEAQQSDDTLGFMGILLGSGIVDNMKPMIKEQLKTSLENTFSGNQQGNQTTNTEVSVSIFDTDPKAWDKMKLISKGGRSYINIPKDVNGSDTDMKLVLTQASDGRYWQFSDIEVADWNTIFSGSQ
ncbi:DUF2939 domain-containing protein [Patescibacteria group bacterium]|nr:DUF2939 domain-containing protein [Patescibacteria group bacterium]